MAAPKTIPITYKQKFFTFIKTHLTITFLLSLIGGVTGLINIYKWTHDKPKFNFYMESFNDGVITNDKVYQKNKFYFITGAIYNDGEEPLFPIAFVLKANVDGHTIVGQSTAINDSLFVTQSKGLNIKYEKQYDLMRTVRINPEDAVFGVLFFPVPYTDLDISKIDGLQIICYDIKRKQRVVNVDVSNLISGYTKYLPKTGISVHY